MRPISTKQLHSIAEGNETAFSELFHSCHHDVAAYMFRITRSHAIAQDLVQDVFSKIWRNRAALAEVQQFEAYIFVICRNTAFNKLKQLARDHMHTKAIAQQQNESSNGVEEIVHYREMAALLNKAIHQLPPQQKKVYQLSREQGLSQEQIAEAMGLSLETVKKHMVLALRSLRSFLHQHNAWMLALLISGSL
ncbi:MAG: RNA polymerase sigma factor [Pseudobacter sp.]|uniref:RNA polymerase sigma factor n=1 Tax=Pseudobacter sp. TaxID=2045420 RepID=UPI003F819174